MRHSSHALVRAKQRGIPPRISQWLDQYGETVHDGHGGIIHYFSARSVRAIERDCGREPVRRLHEFFRAYKVKTSATGDDITIGIRYQSIRRP